MRRRTGQTLLILCVTISFGSLLVDEKTFGSLLIKVTRWLPYSHSTSIDGPSCPLGYGSGAKPPDLHPGNLGSSPSSTTVFVSDGGHVNNHIWSADPDNPSPEAIVVKADRIIYVGSSSEAKRIAGPTATIHTIDHNKFLMPCFIDTHVHLIPAGLLLSRLNLRDIASKHDFVSAVADAAAKAQPGHWVLGGNYDESKWGTFGKANQPTADWFDGISPNNPVFLLRADSHTGLANSKALEMAGITKDTRNPDGGVIEKYEDTGEPTGLLRDAAMQLVIAKIPEPTVEERKAALIAAGEYALSRGVCAVHDMGRVAYQEGEQAAWDDLDDVMVPLANEGKLPIRVYAFMPLTTWRKLSERVKHLGTEHSSGRLTWGGLKDFADGSLGSRTALMHQPYTDDITNTGTRAIELGKLREMVTKADKAGLHVGIHAIGDRAVDEVLDIYQDIYRDMLPSNSSSSDTNNTSGIKGGRGGTRLAHRIEHMQHISSSAAVKRLKELNIAATLNPLHLLLDDSLLEPHLGADRAALSYAFSDIIGSGASVSFASDWPVVDLDPIGTLEAATEARKSKLGGEQQAVGVEEGLIAQTKSAAEIGNIHGIGMLRQGMKADFIILDMNPISSISQKQKQEKTKVIETYIDGICVFGCAEKPPIDIKDEL